MLRDLQALLERDEDLSEEVLEDAALVLLSRQFLYADDHGMGGHWKIVTQHRSYFANLFDALGLELVVREPERMAGIIWRRRPGRWLMRLDEALVLVTLRLIRQEAFDSYQIADFGEVETTAEDIFSRYAERTHRPWPSPARCRELLAIFQQRGLVRLGETIDERNMVVIIRPGILLAVDQPALGSLELYASRQAAATDDEDA